MFGYKLKLVKEDVKSEAEVVNENGEVVSSGKKPFDWKGTAKTVGKVLGTTLLIGGAFLVGKGSKPKYTRVVDVDEIEDDDDNEYQELVNMETEHDEAESKEE